MKSTEVLQRLSKLMNQHTHKIGVSHGDWMYPYCLKLETQGYITVTHISEYAIEIEITETGHKHIKEIS